MYYGQEEDVSTLAASSAKVFGPLERMTRNGTFQQLSLIHQQYVAMKSLQENPEVRNMALVKEDIFEGICKEIVLLQAKYRDLQEQAEDANEEVRESSPKEESMAADVKDYEHSSSAQ